MLRKLIFFLCLATYAGVWANTPSSEMVRVTLSGKVFDGKNGSALPGAAIFVSNTIYGTATDKNGSYKINLPQGDYELVVSFVGYNELKKHVNLQENTTLDFTLTPSDVMLNEVEISAEKPDANVTSTQMSMQKLDVKTIERLPAFMGEVDIIKSIQLLPGITSTSEGGSGFSVRGGSSDQNLVTLDMAPLYNVSHIMGFFSVFNHDALQNVTLYKGDIPPYAGGRLSSYLEVDPRYGNSERWSAKGGVGTISSRLTLDGPIGEHSTLLLAGRATYADLMLKFSSDPAVNDNQIGFYDLNLSYRIALNEKNRIFVTGYNGRDNFSTSFSVLQFGSTLGSVHWNSIINEKLVSDVYITGSRYNYKFGGGPIPDQQILLESRIDDVGMNWIMKNKISDNLEAMWGLSSTKHTIYPGSFKMGEDDSFFNDTVIPSQHTVESALFAGLNPSIGNRLKLKLGARINMFNNIGPGTNFSYDANYQVSDSTYYKSGAYNTYVRFEPRIGFNFLLNNNASIKGSYNQNYQFMHLARNSTGGTPFDIWFSSSPNIKPQRVDQFSLGYFKNIDDNHIELSAEAFYKKYDNTIDFKDFAELFFNTHLEGEVRIGEAQAYGAELLARFNYERWNGWVGYTLSRSERTIPGINDGETYLSPYDKTHDISVVASYQLNPRLSFSGSWVYATGQPYTGPVGKYKQGNRWVPIYSGRNELRMPDYHRLDLSATYQLNKTNRHRYRHSLNVSIYNVYNRHNAWAINFIEDPNNPNKVEGELTYLFPILPAVTYNFNF